VLVAHKSKSLKHIGFVTCYYSSSTLAKSYSFLARKITYFLELKIDYAVCLVEVTKKKYEYCLNLSLRERKCYQCVLGMFPDQSKSSTNFSHKEAECVRASILNRLQVTLFTDTLLTPVSCLTLIVDLCDVNSSPCLQHHPRSPFELHYPAHLIIVLCYSIIILHHSIFLSVFMSATPIATSAQLC